MQRKSQYNNIEPLLMHYKSQLSHYKHVQNLLDAHATKEKSIMFRKNILERQKISNYQNEYDRLRGVLSRTVLPDGMTKRRLKERQQALEKMGALVIDHIV